MLTNTGEGYLQGMLRTLWVLPLLTILTACTGLGTAKTYMPVSPPEMRTAASSLMGKVVINSVPDDPRIELVVMKNIMLQNLNYF